ncbi:hypothetical protein CPC16_004529, partial [Podila verticillata]
ALPALRETQPGIPAIGCAADVLGFYWNMAIIAISSIMILMASALRWKEPSIEKEIELMYQQHDFQSKLISEMAIPMPFPITGGPFYNYQVKKKRIPFMMSRDHLPRSPTSSSASSLAGAPLYSDGGHEYHLKDGVFYCIETGQVYPSGQEYESKEGAHHQGQPKDDLAQSSSESLPTSSLSISSSSSSEPRNRSGGEFNQRKAVMKDGEGSLFSGNISSAGIGQSHSGMETLSSSSSSSSRGIENKFPNPPDRRVRRVTSESTHMAEHRPYLVRQPPLSQLHLPLHRPERIPSLTGGASRLSMRVEEEEEEEPPRYAAGWNSSATLPYMMEDLERIHPLQRYPGFR